jgi:MFS superfamily sulfate permease-like transporter
MKVAAAVLIASAPPAGTVVAAGLLLGVFFLIAGITGLMERLARWVPEVVTSGLQIGLGGALGWMGLAQIAESPIFGLALLALLMVLLWLRPSWPVAVIMLALGIGGGVAFGLVPGGPLPSPRPALPALHWPDAQAFIEGAFAIALPQIPLTLTNAILVAAAMGREYYPQARRLDATRLSLTTGIVNLVTAPLAAMPMCHGAGGIAAHHRFGARTGRTPALLAGVLLTLGLVWGEAAIDLFARVPTALLGVLLLVPALDLVRSARPLDWRGWRAALLALVAALALWSPGIAFVGGTVAAIGVERWLGRANEGVR